MTSETVLEIEEDAEVVVEVETDDTAVVDVGGEVVVVPDILTVERIPSAGGSLIRVVSVGTATEGMVYDGVKGDKGDIGPQGPKGDTGPQGHSPVRGTDYWTQGDVSAVVAEAVAATLAAYPAAEGVGF